MSFCGVATFRYYENACVENNHVNYIDFKLSAPEAPAGYQALEIIVATF